MTDQNGGHGGQGELIPTGEQLWGQAKAAGISRRNFISLMAVGGAAAVLAACSGDPTAAPTSLPTSTPVESSLLTGQVPLPPIDAKVVPTACDYCVVGCGYKVYTWPVGSEGGPKASENALGVD